MTTRRQPLQIESTLQTETLMPSFHLPAPTHRYWSQAWALALLCLTAACGAVADDDQDKAGDWHGVLEELSGALFSVAGTAADDVWVAGADQGGGLGPTVLHYDGSSWTKRDTGLKDGDLLWVHAFDDGTVFFAGAKGRILRRQGGTFEQLVTPDTQYVWGVWGASPDDMWAVGGRADGGHGFIWRYQGKQWTAVTLGPDLPSPKAWFKVWGRAADDVWFCGMGGAMLRYDGAKLAAVDSGTKRNLLTIHGRADGSLITAVGGAFSATLVAGSAGGSWHDVTPAGDPPLQTIGVHHRGAAAYAVGMQGTVLRHDGSGWAAEAHGLPFYEDLHGVWIDPAGGVWAAGGQVVAPPFTDGALIYRGKTPPARATAGDIVTLK